MADLLVTTTPILGGIEIERYIGPLTANVVLGVNFFSDLAASFTDVFGGFSGSYQSKLDSLTSEVDRLIKAKATRLGANAIIDYKLQFNEISGKAKQMFMVSATGTACVVKMPEHAEKEAIDQASYSQVQRQYMITTYRKCIQSGIKIVGKDWDNILSLNLSEIAPELTAEALRLHAQKSDDYSFEAYRNAFFEKFEEFISRQDKTSAIDALCPFLDSYPEIIVSLMVKFNLFKPEAVINMIKAGHISLAIELLKCNKDYYTRQDLDGMQRIVSYLDSLPDKGARQKVKGGLFSKKEEEMYICPAGHQNDKDAKYCLEPGCGLNIKGMTKEQVIIFNKFKKFTSALESLLR